MFYFRLYFLLRSNSTADFQFHMKNNSLVTNIKFHLFCHHTAAYDPYIS